MTNTPHSNGTIWLVEDDDIVSHALSEILRATGYEVLLFPQAELCLEELHQQKPDAVVTDVHLPGMSGLELLARLREQMPFLPVIVMTGLSTTELAIEAIKKGAFDYIVKPFHPEEILSAVTRAIHSYRTCKKTSQKQKPNEILQDTIIGNSPAMREVYKEIGRIAIRPMPILILGETGTGKELVARTLHKHSGRDGFPFVPVNCASIPESLLESQLFGHERGSFTGAMNRHSGYFEQANGGTLFLDEIGELSLAMQAKLLRVLQEKRIQRIGSTLPTPIDVRFIAATHRNVEKLVHEEKFRRDLYFRINVATLRLPRLIDRLEDIPSLVEHFIKQHGNEWGFPHLIVTTDAIELLKRQPWTGNVRELENIVRKAMIVSRGYRITRDIIAEVLALENHDKIIHSNKEETLDAFLDHLTHESKIETHSRLYELFISECERRLLDKITPLTRGNKSEIARWLGLSRVTLREKMRKIETQSNKKIMQQARCSSSSDGIEAQSDSR